MKGFKPLTDKRFRPLHRKKLTTKNMPEAL